VDNRSAGGTARTRAFSTGVLHVTETVQFGNLVKYTERNVADTIATRQRVIINRTTGFR
jgi:hypothetical protein